MDPLLQIKLRRLANRQRWLGVWSLLGTWWAGVGFFGLALLLLRRALGWNSIWMVAVVAFVALGGWLVWLARRRPAVDWHRLASRIEEAHPELEGRLLTVVRHQPGEGATKNYFDERLLREVVQHEQVVDWAAGIPRWRVWTAQTAHWLALVFLGVVCWGLLPVAQKARRSPSEYPAWGVNVSPGDTALEKGNSLVVMARFGGPAPASVELVVSGPGGEAQRIPLVKSLSDPMFGGSVSEVQSNFSYHVVYGDQRTRDFRVTVFEHPKLERADADLVFPAYTALEPKHIRDTRRISAVQGTQIGYSLSFNKPVAAACLVPRKQGAERIVLEPGTNAVAVLSGFQLKESGNYDLLLTDPEGRTNKVPAQFVFLALTNTTPDLKLASPRGDLRPSPLEEIPFEGTVWDDFGVASFGVGYSVAGAEPKLIQLGKSLPGREKGKLHYLLSLEDLGVQPDQLVTWFVWADDIGPNGQMRRTTSDLYFGEVRPFEEVFREAQGMEGSGQGEQGQQGGERQSPSTRAAQLQEQIINATWRIQREIGSRPPAAGVRTNGTSQTAPAAGTRWSRALGALDVLRGGAAFGQTAEEPAKSGGRQTTRRSRGEADRPVEIKADTVVVRDAQREALEQAKATLEQVEDPKAAALWRKAIKDMEQAWDRLSKATEDPGELQQALAAQQSAYEALLKLREHEYQVARSRRGQRQGGNGGQDQMQRQLEQMDLTQTENRYETQSQAQRPPTEQRREELQVLNRLQELARRQQGVNERLKDLQSALQEARTEEDREEIRRQLKRLQDEEQQMLADIDELRQRMDSTENESRMAEQRRQLEQTRENVQQAAEAARQGSASQAAAAGARAQSQLEEMRDQLRKQSSSQFSEDLRQMRNDARDLARQQEELLSRIGGRRADEPKTLSDSAAREETLRSLNAQRDRATNLVQRATSVSQQAETSEPLLSRQLHDTVRKFSQEMSQDMREMQDQLLVRGMMTRSLMDKLLESSTPDTSKLLETASEMLRMDFLPQAREASERARANFDQLRQGVEQAAENVLGDDTEALRQAQQTLDELARQLQAEISRETGATNLTAGAGDGGTNQVASGGSQRSSGREGQPEGREQGDSQPDMAQAQGGQQDQQGAQSRSREGQQNRQSTQAGGGNQPGDRERNAEVAQRQGARVERERGRPDRDGARQGGSVTGGGAEGGDVTRGLLRAMDQLLDNGRDTQSGPIVGEDFLPWSDRLRDVEEMVDLPDLRNEIARVRDRARQMRQEVKRDHKKPDWAVVRLQLVDPLVQVRDQIADELARRGSREALVPIDRDPVPVRYSELVRRYYENLGK